MLAFVRGIGGRHRKIMLSNTPHGSSKISSAYLADMNIEAENPCQHLRSPSGLIMKPKPKQKVCMPARRLCSPEGVKNDHNSRITSSAYTRAITHAYAMARA